VRTSSRRACSRSLTTNAICRNRVGAGPSLAGALALGVFSGDGIVRYSLGISGREGRMMYAIRGSVCCLLAGDEVNASVQLSPHRCSRRITTVLASNVGCPPFRTTSRHEKISCSETSAADALVTVQQCLPFTLGGLPKSGATVPIRESGKRLLIRSTSASV
jgi:hypothetical protein